MDIFSYIKSKDFLGKGMNFKITANGNHQTFYGGFLSTCYYILFWYISYNLLNSMFINRTPSGYSQIKPGSKEKSAELDFEDQKFVYGFRIEDSTGTNVNVRGILFPIFNHVYRNKENGVVEVTRLKTVGCHKVINTTSVDIKSYEIEEFYCPDLSSIANMNKTLRGTFSDTVSSMIEFSYSVCNHDPDNLKCYDPKRMKELFGKKTLWATAIFPYVKYMIDNPVEPLKVELVERYEVLSRYKLPYDEFHLNQYESVSDYNILTTSEESDQAIGISNRESFSKIVKDMPEITEEIKKSVHPEDSSIYFGTIIYEKDLYFYSRRYKKIQDFLGSIVGIMKLIGFGVSYASSAFSKIKLKEFLISQLLIFDNSDKDEEKKNKNSNSNNDNDKIKKYFLEKNKICSNNLENINHSPFQKLNPENGQKEERKEEQDVNMSDVYRNINYPSRENRPIRESSLFPLEPIFESICDPKDNLHKENIKKEEISKYLNQKIEKYNEKNNGFAYNFAETISYMTCGKEKEKDKIVNFFYKKITKKFNIFYYLRQLKNLRIIRKLVLKEEQQIKIIKLISSKEYVVAKKEKKLLSQKEKNFKILKYFMDNYNSEKDTSEQKIFNQFLENK